MSLDIFWESTPVNAVCPNKVKGKQTSALFPLEYLPDLVNLMKAKNEDDFPLRVTTVVNGLTTERLPGKEPDTLVFVDDYTLEVYKSTKKGDDNTRLHTRSTFVQWLKDLYVSHCKETLECEPSVVDIPLKKAGHGSAAVSGKPFPTKVTAASSSVVKKTEPAVVSKDLAVNAFAAATISKTPIKKDAASSSVLKKTEPAVVLKDLAVNAFATATVSKTPIKKGVIQKATEKKNIVDIAKSLVADLPNTEKKPSLGQFSSTVKPISTNENSAKNFGAGYNGKPIPVRCMLPMTGTSYPLNEQQKNILREYLKIPKDSEISDKCIFVLNSEYFVCDREHHVMSPDAMRILHACTGLSLGAIAEQWYSLTHLEGGEVVTVSEDIQTFIRQMKPEVLKEVYIACGFRKASAFGVCELCRDKDSHAVTVCIRYPTIEDRLQVLKDRNACTGCARIECTIGNNVHPTSFHRCCKPCADDNGPCHTSYLCETSMFVAALKKRIIAMQCFVACTITWDANNIKSVLAPSHH